MDDLALALRMADAADAISTDRFLASDLVVETKPDMTPVSDADRAVEERLRSIVATERPGDAILGEEFGSFADRLDNPREWIIDPIDGTKNFVRGVPVWATLIALREGSNFSVGVVSAPALGRRWWACADAGAFCTAPPTAERRGPLRASRVASIADASFAFSDAIEWPSGALDRLLTNTWRQRGYGDFWSHLMVAEGVVDIAAEPALRLHDVAALIPIIKQAGAQITTFDGSEIPWNDPTREFSAVTTNHFLHNSVVNLLQT